MLINRATLAERNECGSLILVPSSPFPTTFLDIGRRGRRFTERIGALKPKLLPTG